MPVNIDRIATGGAFAGPLARQLLSDRSGDNELSPGDQIGPFRIVQEISRGGMAIVYLAERNDGEFAQRVALKWMLFSEDHEIAEAMFRRERDIVAGLEHPGIARLIDGGRSDGVLWFAMELVDGQPIDRWCQANRSSLALRLRLFLELCQALAFAHARLLIHRDIKPANVLVSTEGRLKLLDFGIARLADQRDLLGNTALTPGFASPEQWRGDEVTIASDIFQAGLLLSILVGVLHDLGTTGHVTQTATLQDMAPLQPRPLDPKTLSTLPRDLRAIIEHATTLHPENRYATALALAEDVQRFLDHRPIHARTGKFWYPVQCLMRRHPISSLLACAAVLGLAFLWWQLLLQRNAATQQAARANAEATRANAQALRASSALDFMFGLLDWATPETGRGEPVSVDAALERGIVQLEEQVRDQPQLRAELLAKFGEFYARKRKVEKAISLLEAAYELQEQIPGLDPFVHSDTGTRLANMLGADKFTRAMALLEKSIHAMQGRTDADSVRLRIASQRFLAQRYYQNQSNITQARALVEIALRDSERQLPVGNTEQLALQRELATYLGALGELDGSLALRRDVLRQARLTLGADHPSTLQASQQMVRLLIGLGEVREAGAELALVEVNQSKTWGALSAPFSNHLYLKALLSLASKQPEPARAYITQALDIAERSGAGGLLYLSRFYVCLALIDRDSGNLAAAETELRKALNPEIYKHSSLRDFGHFRLELIKILRLQNHFADIPAELVIIDTEMRPLPPEHIQRGQALLERAFLALERDAIADAKQFLAEAITIISRSQKQVARENALAEANQLLAHLQAM